MVQAMSVNDSRLQLWRDVLALISQNPWAGIGFGQLEFFRSFSDLPNAMKTIHVNAHMLPLQIAVEYGLPVAGLFFGLLAFGFFKAGKAWRDPVGNFALANIVMILLHSMTEFPLWYAFILLPFAFLLGLYLASGRAGALQEPTSPQGLATFRRMYTYAALAVVGGIVLSVAHYLPTIAMYVLHSKDITREDRLATANRAFLYKHWIVYNAIGGTSLADISQHPELLALFDKSSRFYMNEFNMAQYALALAENGEDAKAARVVFALRRIESSQLADLRAYCAGATTPGARRLLDLIDAKAEPTVTAKDF
jgi:O-antigen ligase